MTRPWAYPEIIAFPLVVLTDEERRRPGTWWLQSEPSGERTTWICCPSCGHSAPLRSHVVSADGMVMGMIACVAPPVGLQLSCGWAFRVHLENR